MKIFHKESLEFYDCELLFEAEDETGRKYIAVHDADFDTGCEYIVVPVLKNRLTDFKAGLTDLRSLMQSCEENIWYKANIDVHSKDIDLVPQGSAIFEDDVLPDQDYYINRSDISTTARRFSIESGRPAFAFTVSGTSETDAHEIPSSTLMQFFRRINESLKQFVLERYPSAEQETYQLNMIASPIPSSFGILLASPIQTNMFGDNHIISAFEQLTSFINADFEADSGLQEIERHNSGTLKEIKLTTQAIISTGTDVMVEWSAGRSGKSGTARISKDGARRIAEKLSTITRLTTSTVILEGRLDAINVTQKTWSIIAEDAGKLSGRIQNDGPSLEGRTTGKRYRIVCEQTIDEMADENVKPSLVATHIEELQEFDHDEEIDMTGQKPEGEQLEFGTR